MRKAVLGAYSLLLTGALSLVILPPPPVAVQAAGVSESLNSTIEQSPIQKFKVAGKIEPIQLDRSSYSATTTEELAAIKAQKAAEEKAVVDAEKAKQAKETKAKTQVTSLPAPTYSGGGSPAEWMTAAGIPESDWGYVNYIVGKESGWNPNAVNSSSGASGLVQALPCGKVPGSCFDPVDNLKWADGYAKGRYGSWAGAYDFWVSNNWW